MWFPAIRLPTEEQEEVLDGGKAVLLVIRSVAHKRAPGRVGPLLPEADQVGLVPLPARRVGRHWVSLRTHVDTIHPDRRQIVATVHRRG